MSTSLVSSTSRPMKLRMRADLVVQQQTHQGAPAWVVKDPISLKYFRFQEEEFALLEMLDGRTSLDEMRRKFERRFPTQKITFEEITHLTSSLHQAGLIISDAGKQATQLVERRRSTAKRELFGRVTNLLAIRWRIFNPDRLLDVLDQWCGWFFSPTAIFFCLMFCAAALLLVTVQFETFRSRLPEFGEFFAVENWFWLAVALAGTKVLHEIGHGLSCKRLGGTCHETGIMFLVFTPCLYVDVTDSCMLPSKWHRAAIGAAGMYVELVIAAACTFIWWFSEPGLLNYLALNVMFVSSVSTLLFNANPLLKYDGYYILSDLIEIPNLRTKAESILRRKAGAWVLGLEEPLDPLLPERHQFLFATFAVLAPIYRWIMCLSILWFLNQVLKPYGLQALGQLLALTSIYALVVHPIIQLVYFFQVPGRVEKVNKVRVSFCAAAAAFAIGLVLAVPLPYYVECPAHLRPRNASPVYVAVPGQLTEIHVAGGQLVQPGVPVVTLASVEAKLSLAQLEGQREELLSRVDDLRRRQFQDEEASMQVAEAEQSLHALEEQVARRQRSVKQLQVTAPAGGVVFPPAITPQTPPERGELPTWHGTPLEQRNLGADLGEGTLVCLIGQPGEVEAMIDIDQSDVEFIRPGQAVKVQFGTLPGRTFRTEVSQVAQLERDHRAGELEREVRKDQRGANSQVNRALDTKFQASAPIDDDGGALLPGVSGTARIHAGYRTLGQRAWRYLAHTFRFAS